MLPSWRDRLHIVLAPDSVSLVRLGRGVRSHETLRKSLACGDAEADQPLWQPAVQCMQKLLTQSGGNAEAVVVLSSNFVRYVLVPPQADLADDAEEEAYVRFCFSEIYGEDAEGWSLRWGGSLAVDQQVASAIDAALVDAIEAALRTAGVSLRSVQPYLMTALNVVRGQMSSNRLWVVLVESGRVSMGHFIDGVWNTLHSMRLGQNWIAELPGLLAREFQMAAAGNQTKDILLCLPQHMNRHSLPLEGWNVRMLTLNADSLSHGSLPRHAWLGTAVRKLKLDYRDDRQLQHAAGFMLLAMSLGLMAVTVWYYMGLSSERVRLDSVIQKVESQIQQNDRPSTNFASEPEKAKEIMAFSSQVIQKLNLPWDDLFSMLEVAKGDDIALLGVEPDTKKPTIKLSGEAKDFSAMFDYVRALRAKGLLKSVYLVDHKIDDQNPDKPIRFTLEASWAAKP